jgi:tetratricopeptide (TPR) repeat protein
MSDSSTITTAFTTATQRQKSNAIPGSLTNTNERFSLPPTTSGVDEPKVPLSKLPVGGYQFKKYQNSTEEAEDFYRAKLAVNPNMARYNTFMATIAAEKGNHTEADQYYRQALVAAPGDVNIRNDFALHMAENGNYDKKQDAIKEIRKTLLQTETNATIQKNIAALYARTGQYANALHHADESRFLTAQDAMNHRNLAKLHAALGDTHKALEYNMQVNRQLFFFFFHSCGCV